MVGWRRWFLGLGVGVLLVAAGCRPASWLPECGPDGCDPPAFASLTQFIEDEVSSRRLTGAALVLVRGDEAVYARSFGGFTLETAVPIASSSKWPAASVILSLVDEGLIRLDDPVAMYLPGFSQDPDKARITIRHCLAFTSGYWGEHACLENRLITLADCVAQIRDQPLMAAPGEAFYYGGASYQIAGLIAEVVTGQSWYDLFDERIAGPLGMTDTRYAGPGNPQVPGGIVSTAADYIRFVRMHLNGGVFEGRQVLSAQSVAEMQSEQRRGAGIGYVPAPLADKDYGLGLWRDVLDEQGEAVEVQSIGAFGFFPWLDHRRNLAGVFVAFDDAYALIDFIRQMQQRVRDIVDATAPAG